MNRLYSAFSAFLCLISCTGGAPAPRHAAQPAVKVRVQTVSMESSGEKSSFVGEVVSSKSSLVCTPNPGKLVSLNVRKGDVVGQGQILATVGSTLAESAYKIASANLEQARDGYERASAVYSENGISEVQYMDIKTKLRQAEAAMESAGKSLEDCKIKAPWAGVVSEVHTDEGVELAPGQAIVSILDMNGLEIRISVHENEIGHIRKGSCARIDVPALGIESLRARVTARNFFASTLSHAYDCNLTLGHIPSGLLPGMSVRVVFEENGAACLTVPAEAVQLDREGHYLWLCDNGTVRKARIRVGGYSGKGIIVSEGLSEGDKVIVAGYHKVSGGMKVSEE